MTADLGLVAHAAERHAHELAIGRARDALPQRRLADARGPNETQYRTLQRLHALLHREILEDALLDLLETVVIFFEDALGVREILVNLGALAPRHLDEPVDVVAHHRRFGRHRRHQLQLAQLRGSLLLGVLRHAGGLDALLELRELVRRILHFAELLLNGLHLLIQVVLALALLHLLLDAAADALLDPQHVDLAVDEAEHVLEPLPNAGDLEHLLLLGQLERHLRGDRIGQTPRRIDSRQGGQNLRRNLLVELDVLLEARHHGASQDVHLAAILLTTFGQLLGFRGEAVRHEQVAQARSSDALHEDFDRAIRQLQELQDRCQRADLVDVLRPRLVDVRLCLGDEQDLAIAGHRLIQRGDRPFAADEQRNHRVRIHDNVAQRQNRESADSRSFGAICHGFRSRESAGAVRRRRWHGSTASQRRRRRRAASDVRLQRRRARLPRR